MNLQDARVVLAEAEQLSDTQSSLNFLSAVKECTDDINARDNSGKKYCLQIAQVLGLFVINEGTIVTKQMPEQKDAKIARKNRVAESYAQIMNNYSRYTE